MFNFQLNALSYIKQHFIFIFYDLTELMFFFHIKTKKSKHNSKHSFWLKSNTNGISYRKRFFAVVFVLLLKHKKCNVLIKLLIVLIKLLIVRTLGFSCKAFLSCTVLVYLQRRLCKPILDTFKGKKTQTFCLSKGENRIEFTNTLYIW